MPGRIHAKQATIIIILWKNTWNSKNKINEISHSNGDDIGSAAHSFIRLLFASVRCWMLSSQLMEVTWLLELIWSRHPTKTKKLIEMNIHESQKKAPFRDFSSHLLAKISADDIWRNNDFDWLSKNGIFENADRMESSLLSDTWRDSVTQPRDFIDISSILFLSRRSRSLGEGSNMDVNMCVSYWRFELERSSISIFAHEILFDCVIFPTSIRFLHTPSTSNMSIIIGIFPLFTNSEPSHRIKSVNMFRTEVRLKECMSALIK